MGEILFCEFDLNDHGFATDGLIEIKTRSFCTMGTASMGRESATEWANRQVDLRGCWQMLWFRCRPRRDTLRRCVEFVQMPFHIKRDRVNQGAAAVSRAWPADGAGAGGSALSEGAALAVGRVGHVLGAGLQVTPVQRRTKHHEHRNDADGNEQGIGWHVADLL